ncbi:MAG: class I SAM-dependent methyltransferase, partial [candidate division WOR-3 bacterium]|nr:class I SAM-dependent methyltransferase [candidate division WOR-3 bacterium]
RVWDLINSFKSYVEDRYLVLYSTQKLAQILKMNLRKGKVKIIKGDSSNMSDIEDNSFDGILTSPPYFDALDYIGNNKISILILGLDQDLDWESTKQFYEAKHRDEEKYEKLPLFVSDKYFSIKLPPSSLKLIKLLDEARRSYKSKVVENYLKMMKLSFDECYRVLKNNKYYLMVVSKYHKWLINGEEQTIETSSILADLGKSVGFKVADIIEHGLSKADKGKIGVEDILVFQK